MMNNWIKQVLVLAVISILLFLVILWATGCIDSVRAWNERAAREEYARARAECYDAAGYWGEPFREYMKEKGWQVK